MDCTGEEEKKKRKNTSAGNFCPSWIALHHLSSWTLDRLSHWRCYHKKQ